MSKRVIFKYDNRQVATVDGTDVLSLASQFSGIKDWIAVAIDEAISGKPITKRDGTFIINIPNTDLTWTVVFNGIETEA